MWWAGAVDDHAVEVQWWARDEMRRDKPVQKSDLQIQLAVQDAFLSDPRVLSVKPEVEVHEGIVTLRGAVSRFIAKTAAEEDARHTLGVRAVRNNIQVRPVRPPDDATIGKHVATLLETDPLMNRVNISVAVRDGIADLSGVVESGQQKQRAEDAAARVASVVEVRNRIQVASEQIRKADAEIKQAIERELFWSQFVDRDQVRVSVNDGVATLSGIVDGVLERDLAIENAREAGARGSAIN